RDEPGGPRRLSGVILPDNSERVSDRVLEGNGYLPESVSRLVHSREFCTYIREVPGAIRALRHLDRMNGVQVKLFLEIPEDALEDGTAGPLLALQQWVRANLHDGAIEQLRLVHNTSDIRDTIISTVPRESPFSILFYRPYNAHLASVGRYASRTLSGWLTSDDA
ncbi:hypothetical protein FOL46_007159, partial [Perkinsus olseni]